MEVVMQSYVKILLAVGAIYYTIGFGIGLFHYQDINSLCVTLGALVACISSTFSIVYFRKKETHFESLVSDFERVIQICMDDPLSEVNFQVRLLRNMKLINIASRFAPWTVTISVAVYSLRIYIRSLNLFGFEGKKSQPYDVWFPFDTLTTPYYDCVTFINVTLITILSAPKVCVQIYFLAMFTLQRTFLQHLRDTFGYTLSTKMENLITNDQSEQASVDTFQTTHRKKSFCWPCANDLNRSINAKHNHNWARDTTHYQVSSLRLRQWIQIHQQVLLLGEDLCKLYSGIFTAFLGDVICITTLGLLVITDPDFNISAIVTPIYVAFTLASLLVICNIGNSLTHESATVTELGYYGSTKEVNNSLLVILKRTQKPLEAVSYIHGAKLSRETFVTLCNLIMSYFLALIKIKGVKQNK